MKPIIDKENFIKICNESGSMAKASMKLGLHFNTFKKYAIMFGCYNPNPSGKGLKKEKRLKIKTEDILSGKYPEYQTYKLKLRLLREGYFEDKCSICGWSDKLPDQEFSSCELHHKDGNPHNHLLSNLELLCPNCHSVTYNYRSRNRALGQETS